MTPEERQKLRMDIARDVLVRLEDRSISPSTVSYVDVRLPRGVGVPVSLVPDPEKDKLVIDALRVHGAYCEVCAVGSLFIGQASLGKSPLPILQTQLFSSTKTSDVNAYGVRARIVEVLSEAFDAHELNVIESFFQLSSYVSEGHEDYPKMLEVITRLAEARSWLGVQLFCSPEARLRFVMDAITFYPSFRPWELDYLGTRPAP